MNAIQFQRGLSLPQFQARYGTEQQCERALVVARWPHGWQCAHCGCKRFFLTRNRQGRQLWECFICGYQSSSIVGTVMEHTHLPLRVWFLAMYLMTQNKNAISALALKRQLGVSYKSAWLLKHKLMQTMGVRDARYRLQGRVEIDDAYLGGERAGSINGGRKPANKTAFIAAVQTPPDGRPLYMRLTPVADLRQPGRSPVGSAPPGCGLPCGERRHASLCPGAPGGRHARAVCDRWRPPGGTNSSVALGEHLAGQPQDQHGGHLPRIRSRPLRGSLSGRVLLPVQSPL